MWGGHKTGRIDFLTIFLFFDRDFETLAFKIFEIQFQIQIPRHRMMLSPYFQLIPWKIADFKGNWYLFGTHFVWQLKSISFQNFTTSRNFLQFWLTLQNLKWYFIVYKGLKGGVNCPEKFEEGKIRICWAWVEILSY